MEWIIGIIVVIVVLWFLGSQRRGAEVEKTIQSDRAVEESGDWVEVRVHALTERGGEVQWASKGRTEDEAVTKATTFLNEMARSRGMGRVVKITNREVVDNSDQ